MAWTLPGEGTMDQKLNRTAMRNILAPFSYDALVRREEGDESGTAVQKEKFLFDSGDVIMQEDPFAAVVDSESSSRICHHCFASKLVEELKRCSICKFGRYCDGVCAKQAWKTHKQECTLLAAYFAKREFYPDALIRLVHLVIVKVRKGQIVMPENSCQPPTDRDFNSLMSHTEDIDDEIMKSQKFSHNMREITEYLRVDLTATFDEEFLTESYSQVMTNCIAIQDRTGRQVGIGLYLGISQFDHSCVPNAVYFCRQEPPRLSIVATRAIKTLSDVRISYVDPMQQTVERRSELKESHYFTCQCARCHSFEHDGMQRSLKCQQVDCFGFVLLGKDRCPMGPCELCGARLQTDVLKEARQLMETVGDLLGNYARLSADELSQVQPVVMKDVDKYLYPLNIFSLRIWRLALRIDENHSKEDDCDFSLTVLENFVVAYWFYLGPVSLPLLPTLVKVRDHCERWRRPDVWERYADQARWLAEKLIGPDDNSATKLSD